MLPSQQCPRERLVLPQLRRAWPSVCAAWLGRFRQLEQEEELDSTGRGVEEALPLHSVLREVLL